MIVCLLMVMVRDDCLFVDGHQQTNNQLSPLPSTNKQSSLTIIINKQTIFSPLSSKNKQSSLTITREMTVCLLRIMVRVDCLFVDVNGER
jgi:hypothetical protein